MTAPRSYGTPRRVWVEHEHVFVQGHDDVTLIMLPEVAIELSRLLGNAGADALINRIRRGAKPAPPPPGIAPE